MATEDGILAGLPDPNNPNDKRQLESLTPAGVEMWLRRSAQVLAEAQSAVRLARDVLTDLEIAYRRSWRRAMLSADCPVPNRSSVTVAYRDAWVEEECAAEWEAMRMQEVVVESAKDQLKTAHSLASLCQSIASSVRQAYHMATGQGGNW